MTDHTEAAAHYAIQHEHANDLNELKRLREVNAELVAALKLCAAVCAGNTTNKRGLVEALEAARAALAKASK
jgi:hypothetical protein